MKTTIKGVLFLKLIQRNNEEKFPDGPWCKAGDYVMFRMNTGTRFKVNGKEFRLMNDDSIEAVIPDPRGICNV